MNTELILNYLNTYNDLELFYKVYHTKKQDHIEFQAFLNSLSPEEVQAKGAILPELMPDELPTLMLDDDYFDNAVKRNVYLLKHNRYTPEFEHTHVFFEIVYVLTGSCKHTFLHETQTMKQGDLFLISPTVSHSIFVDDDSIIINILIRRSTIEDIFFNTLRDNSIVADFFLGSIYMRNYSSFLIFHTDNDMEIRNYVLEMYLEMMEGNEFSDRIISSMLMIFFIKLVRKYKKTAQLPFSRNKSMEQASNLLHIIHNNYATITLAELAGILNYSIPHCSKYIKLSTGYTFSQLLKKVRFQKAESFLLNTRMSIQKISELVGYENQENFIRAFKQEYKLSPTQFRNQ